MIYKPYPYQQFAEDKIIDLPAVALMLFMGAGKTVITLTAVDKLLHDYFDVCRCLVIAPLRVAEDTWSREAAKWDHLRHLSIAKALGSPAARSRAVESAAEIVIINRENVPWLVEHYGRHWPFDMVVVDELSGFKSHQAQRFRALRRVRPQIHRIVGLTGTPAPNGLIDLWAQIYLLDQGERLGRFITHYRERYFEPDKRNATTIFSYKPKPDAEKAIYQKIGDICVSMKDSDWLTLPGRIDRVVPVALPSAAQTAYKQLEKDLILQLAGDDVIKAGTAATLSNKLLQMANGAAYTEDGRVQEIHSAKLEALANIIEAANGRPVLVFYSYKHDVERIRKYFGKLHPRVLADDRDIADWNAGKIPLLLAHPASCGYGLNLQAGGNIIVWFGLTWSLEQYQQANARLYRQGQTEAVIIHHLVAEGTIDEDVMKALQRKAVGQDALLTAVKARLEKYLAA